MTPDAARALLAACQAVLPLLRGQAFPGAAGWAELLRQVEEAVAMASKSPPTPRIER